MANLNKKTKDSIINLILTVIVFITAAIVFLVTYKSGVPDPIENIKNIFLSTYLIIILAIIVILILVRFNAPNDIVLVRRLKILFAISMAIIVIFLGIKMALDIKYSNGEGFKKIYEEQHMGEEENDMANKLSIDLNGIDLLTDKDFYIKECQKSYNIFRVKVAIMLGLHMLINIVMLYKILKIDSTKKVLTKHDKVVFKNNME